MNDVAPLHSSDPDWPWQVLRFWFQDLDPKAWFTRSEDTDARTRRRFSLLPADLCTVDPRLLATSAKGALAAVIVLDQFPRNMHRGTAEAFAYDDQALMVAQRAIGLGLDRLLRRDERLFLYLPFEHSENARMQARSVELMARLGNSGWHQYALAHKEIIDRFGRFPHRNVALGRASTPDELAFLQTSGSSF
jgi:uncharacterized protein (DUF924 family)